MNRIRVDTDELKTKAGDFESAAGTVAGAGDELLTAALSLPSYEGQLSCPARAAGYEIQRRSRELQAALAGDAQALQAAARSFETVENQTIEGLVEIRGSLTPCGGFELRGIDVGTSYLGYRDDGIGDTVILCMYRVCRRIPRAGNEACIAEFEAKVDEYEKHKKEMLDNLHRTWAAGTLATAGFLGITVASAGLAMVIAVMTAVGSLGGSLILEEAALYGWDRMVDDVYGASYYWNKLFGETGLGECVQGDDKQSPLDLLWRNDQEIYEPEGTLPNGSTHIN